MIQKINLTGIGPKTAVKLEKLGINSSSDLLFHFPSRYIDFSHITTIASAPINENITISGTITSFNNIYSRSGKNIQKATLQDSTGTIDLLWFNQPFLNKILTVSSHHLFAGVVNLHKTKKTIIAPIHGQYNTGKIIGIYPETSGLTSNWFRKIIQQNIDHLLLSIIDTLPPPLLSEYHLLPLSQALKEIHCPQNQSKLEQARLRLGLNELLSIQANSYLKRKEWLQSTPKHIIKPYDQIDHFIESLPFKLTPSQISSWHEIQSDLISPTKVTNRLLTGDVGSGKTIIAILSALTVFHSHHQTIVIAPTQILAKQHHLTFTQYLKKLKIKISLLSSADKLSATQINQSDIIIATHAALFKKSEQFNRVGLVIIDEQHKFGVKQRSFFHQNSQSPHTLTMTATPIPRTISLTLFGNLDLSCIRELPKNRLPVKTFLVENAKQKQCYQWMEKEINSTHCQAFIVCPFIEPSESNTSVKAAKQEFAYLQKEIFPNLKLALIHGQIKANQRHKILTDFKKNKIQIIVTTPVIEVGIDFPNATIMIIQSAERFGLAQLHQLRGRVGRGAIQSYCYLFTQNPTDGAVNRLNFLTTHHLGQDVAEYDLKIRGPGELFSLLQHGFPSLKLASLSDTFMINLSQEILSKLIDHYPQIKLHQFVDNSALFKFTAN